MYWFCCGKDVLVEFITSEICRMGLAAVATGREFLEWFWTFFGSVSEAALYTPRGGGGVRAEGQRTYVRGDHGVICNIERMFCKIVITSYKLCLKSL